MIDTKTSQPTADLAWKGTWSRPLRIDVRGLHPFTVARMTDHNVKGKDEDEKPTR